MGDQIEGYEVIPPDLRKALEVCADQAPILRGYAAEFAPARLREDDFGLAPGADELGLAYVDGTQEYGHRDKRYESAYNYVMDLCESLEYLSKALEVSEQNYRAASRASASKDGGR
ncbi:hypothetical protein AB0F17_31440 [Nonomuraea sp. NPDC026600]|uniref:hypothetical protein n=1 Tax=Nonomuraea sp. NPDC026600 TaxID=3155363 RepID=UPI0033CFBD47